MTQRCVNKSGGEKSSLSGFNTAGNSIQNIRMQKQTTAVLLNRHSGIGIVSKKAN